MIFDVDRKTIERWLNKWDLRGVKSLPIATGRGVNTH